MCDYEAISGASEAQLTDALDKHNTTTTGVHDLALMLIHWPENMLVPNQSTANIENVITLAIKSESFFLFFSAVIR